MTTHKNLLDLPYWPRPVWDNTCETGIDYSAGKVLDTGVSFDEMTTFWRRKLKLSLIPCLEPGIPSLHIGDHSAPIHIGNIVEGNNNIGIHLGCVQARILEHVFGVLYGLGIDADILLDAGTFPFSKVSLPTKADCAQAYIDALTPDRIDRDGTRETFTVKNPIKIDFGNKRGSYVILLPDKGSNELVIDLMVSHPGSSIGTQRIKCKITEDVLRKYVAGARTPSYGFRRKLMKILDTYPFLQRVVNIDTSRTFSFDKDIIHNPRETYTFNGENTELLMHEVLDKLGAYGIPLTQPGRFVGTIMLYACGHAQDLAVMRAMERGIIPTV